MGNNPSSKKKLKTHTSARTNRSGKLVNQSAQTARLQIKMPRTGSTPQTEGKSCIGGKCDSRCLWTAWENSLLEKMPGDRLEVALSFCGAIPSGASSGEQ